MSKPLIAAIVVALPLVLVASCFVGVVGAVVGGNSTVATPTSSDTVTTVATAAQVSNPTPTPSSTINAQRGSVLAAAYDLKVVTGAAAERADLKFHRNRFGRAWKDIDRNGCDQRNDVLRRDLTKLHTKPGTNGCVLSRGVLESEYTGKTVKFTEGGGDIDIDHVVSLARRGAREPAPGTARSGNGLRMIRSISRPSRVQ